LRRCEAALLGGTWRQVHGGLQVQFVQLPEQGGKGEELYVLCRSAGRRKKELAILERFVTRMEEGLTALQSACARPRAPLRDKLTLGKRLGALLSRNSRAARLFDITPGENTDGTLLLTWKRKQPEGTSWPELAAGAYLLRTNIAPTLCPEQIWNSYVSLVRVEDNFRKLKSHLGLRPLFHQKAERVRGHVFICFLALILLQSFEQRLDQFGLGRSPQKVLAELAAWHSMDLVIPTTTGRTLRRRLIATPDTALKILLARMGLHMPKATHMLPM
jgi:hypothetical protein